MQKVTQKKVNAHPIRSAHVPSIWPATRPLIIHVSASRRSTGHFVLGVRARQERKAISLRPFDERPATYPDIYLKDIKQRWHATKGDRVALCAALSDTMIGMERPASVDECVKCIIIRWMEIAEMRAFYIVAQSLHPVKTTHLSATAEERVWCGLARRASDDRSASTGEKPPPFASVADCEKSTRRLNF